MEAPPVQAPQESVAQPFVFVPIKFPEPAPAPEPGPDVLALEREKFEKRAQRFGIAVIEPKKDLFVPRPPKTHKNPRGGFISGIDLAEEEERKKREARAERFGVPVQSLDPQPVAPESEVDPNAVMATDPLQPRREPTADLPVRSTVLHLYGTDTMSTRDVFNYFGEFGPAEIEWLDDSSCNVVFLDAPGAWRALQGIGREVMTGEAAGPNPQTNPWRRGPAGKGGAPLLLRYATAVDVKPSQRPQSAHLWESRNRKTSSRKLHNNRNNRMDLDEKPESTVSAKIRKGNRKPRNAHITKAVEKDLKAAERIQSSDAESPAANTNPFVIIIPPRK